MVKIYAIEIVNLEECIAFFAKNDREVIKLASDEYGVKRSDVVILESRPATELEIAMNRLAMTGRSMMSLFTFKELMGKTLDLFDDLTEGLNNVNIPQWHNVQKIRELEAVVKDMHSVDIPKSLPNSLKFKNDTVRWFGETLNAIRLPTSVHRFNTRQSRFLSTVRNTISKVDREEERLFKQLEEVTNDIKRIDPSLMDSISARL